MDSKLPIADMYVFSLRSDATGRVLLREDDHLLRRFGQLEIRDLAAGTQTEFSIRAEADRFFFLLSGRATLHLVDLRQGSPSHGTHATVALAESQPQGVLVPFGTATGLVAELASRVLILSTHSQPHANDRTATPDELEKYAAIQ